MFSSVHAAPASTFASSRDRPKPPKLLALCPVQAISRCCLIAADRDCFRPSPRRLERGSLGSPPREQSCRLQHLACTVEPVS